MNKLFNKNYLSNANKIKKELELLDFLEKKISKIDSNIEKKIYGVLKKKRINELNNLNFAIESLKSNYAIEKKNLDELLKIKKNLTLFLKQNESDYISNIKKQINPDLLCNICYENRINLVLNPCGHIFCDNCFKNSEKTCYICRKCVVNSIKIFIN
jgi:hypothetical protein